MMNVEVFDSGGLICGFVLRPGGAEPLAWNTELAPGALPEFGEAPLWLHFNLVDTRSHAWIAACEALPEEAREAMLESDAHIRLDLQGEAIIGALGDFYHDYDEDPEGFDVLRIYLSRKLIVTGRRHPLRSTNALRRELLAGAEVESPLLWLAHFANQLAESFTDTVGALGATVDELEDRILAGRSGAEGKELGRIRRLLARLRRMLTANRQALTRARARLPRWCIDDEAGELRQVGERLDALAQDIELVQERSRLLQEEIAGRLGEATNRNLYLLSIVTTVMLPITLITGVFGMNVAGLPWLQDPAGFVSVMMMMGFVAVATLVVLRWRRLI